MTSPASSSCDNGETSPLFHWLPSSELGGIEVAALTLMQAIANSSYIPAKELGPHIPQFNTKGRLQVGMDADITVFDPKTVKANATWDDVAALNDGFQHTLVNGVFILKDGEIDTEVLPGQQIRR